MVKALNFFFLSGFSFTTIHESQDCRGISLTPHYHFHPLHRHLDISRAIIVESSPLHMDNNQTARTGNLWFPSTSHSPLNYPPSKSAFNLCRRCFDDNLQRIFRKKSILQNATGQLTTLVNVSDFKSSLLTIGKQKVTS